MDKQLYEWIKHLFMMTFKYHIRSSSLDYNLHECTKYQYKELLHCCEELAEQMEKDGYPISDMDDPYMMTEELLKANESFKSMLSSHLEMGGYGPKQAVLTKVCSKIQDNMMKLKSLMPNKEKDYYEDEMMEEEETNHNPGSHGGNPGKKKLLQKRSY